MVDLLSRFVTGLEFGWEKDRGSGEDGRAIVM